MRLVFFVCFSFFVNSKLLFLRYSVRSVTGAQLKNVSGVFCVFFFLCELLTLIFKILGQICDRSTVKKMRLVFFVCFSFFVNSKLLFLRYSVRSVTGAQLKNVSGVFCVFFFLCELLTLIFKILGQICDRSTVKKMRLVYTTYYQWKKKYESKYNSSSDADNRFKCHDRQVLH